MLKGIPGIISPELLDVLMRMGHGDTLALVDQNFPSDSVAAQTVWGSAVSLTGTGLIPLLEAVLRLMPLDEAADKPAVIMAAPPDLCAQPIHLQMTDVLDKAVHGAVNPEFIPRFTFYERARGAFAVVRTSETARYANIIIQKGVVTATV